ncbi:double-stranded RNA-binding protein Staufen homolog 2-like isoform X3 [Branchiostoma lanceolatum]|uniref:double-stranded RNA-binding protein Staufen homolog 2-like isoform X1 n=1 Tax=Branchiostoma lanceolatum TaxID=7740 RepID=UPI003456CD82
MSQLPQTASPTLPGAPPAGAPPAQGGMNPTPGIITPTQGAAGVSPAVTGSALANGTVVTAHPAAPSNMANPKEKTPMCLINELARYNKIQPQYKLITETGPAHQKTFTISLTLADKTWTAEGSSLKKAQHAAASKALDTCNLPWPKPKPPRNQELTEGDVPAGSITPTVELNGLAMRRGEPAIYRPIDPKPTIPPQYRPNYNFRGIYNQRYHYPTPKTFYVSLTIGNREFIGEGRTRQQARHNAAAKALKVLKDEPIPETADPPQPAPDVLANEKAENLLKPEITLVYEIARKRNMSVSFEVVKESGPPHMKTFVTSCKVGDFVAEGEGNGKKVSKKRAAQKVLEQLKVLPLLHDDGGSRQTKRYNKKRPKSLIKVGLNSWIEADVTELNQTNPDYGQGINPVSRLIQIQQARKEKEPEFSLQAERGLPRRREFVMQVTVKDKVCTGIGPNKKLAKRSAAEAMLQLLGYRNALSNIQPGKPALKTGDGQGDGPGNGRKVKFVDQTGEVKDGHGDGPSILSRQLAPGLLPMPQEMVRSTGGNGIGLQGVNMSQRGLNRAPGAPLSPRNPQLTSAAIAKELLTIGTSPTAEAMVQSGVTGMPQGQQVPPKQQLAYLAKVQGFRVDFTDFPKGNKSEYLSLVSLSSNPPLVSHGAGLTVEAAHDQAALNALKSLMDMGLDRVDGEGGADKSEGVKEEKSSVVSEHKQANSAEPDMTGSLEPVVKTESK